MQYYLLLRPQQRLLLRPQQRLLLHPQQRLHNDRKSDTAVACLHHTEQSSHTENHSPLPPPTAHPVQSLLWATVRFDTVELFPPTEYA